LSRLLGTIESKNEALEEEDEPEEALMNAKLGPDTLEAVENGKKEENLTEKRKKWERDKPERLDFAKY